jgi:hypothetical protein
MRTVILLIALAAVACAQPIFGGGKAAAIIGPRGATLPASCATDGLVYALTATDGGNARGSYVCVNGTYVSMTAAAGEGTGDVVGPAASVAGEAAVYDGVTGKLLKRFDASGVLISTTGVLSTDSGLQFNTSTGLGLIKPLTLGQITTQIGTLKLWGTASLLTVAPAAATAEFTFLFPPSLGRFQPSRSPGQRRPY